MAESIKSKVQEAGHKIAETASEVGHKASEMAEKASDWTKEKMHHVGHKADEASQKVGHKIEELKGSGSGCCHSATSSEVKEHMDVVASCGRRVGVVDHLEAESIKLTKKDSADGHHHLIPQGWVDHVDQHVHLNKNSEEVERGWQTV
jgi:hypothetical protein